ncbi:Protein CBG27408 [Caenorhabditis briggsae]|uniref:Protein CBG27408 n=1 Tax=Caenorhabditis briggsae TaxID=6238 RepID=B6IJY5_CAEBR|nr:Protein CBG27408 [Caenorhabditis briggsae]CAS00215.1 Protein CBG27408 [Caenorhabditis briggsae]
MITLSFLFFSSCLLTRANCQIDAIIETYLVLENAEEHGTPLAKNTIVVFHPVYTDSSENVARPDDPSTTMETGTAPSFPKPPTVLAACQRIVATIIRESCEFTSGRSIFLQLISKIKIPEENLIKVLEKCCREPCSLMEIVQGCISSYHTN